MEKQENKELKICHTDSPTDGPMDGVKARVECIRTDFIENPNGEDVAFQQRPKTSANITASVEIGVFGIRDIESGVMLTVSLTDAMEVMKAALDAAKKEDE